MPLNSVQLYVKGLLNGIALPGQASALPAYVTPPVFDNVNGPRCYVWGGRVTGSRQTMPRYAGYRKLPWLVDIWLVYVTNPNNADVDSEFPLIVDAVLDVLWTTTMPVWIDANGNVTTAGAAGATQIQAIGEEWSLDYPPERTPGSMRMLWYSTLITATVLEVPQG